MDAERQNGNGDAEQAAGRGRAGGRAGQLPVFVCHNGIFVVDPRAYHPVEADEVKVRFGHRLHREAGVVLLPDCRSTDDLLDQPPLGLGLSQAEASDLVIDMLGATNASAATDFGIDLQAKDKGSNQDFALSATIRVGDRAYQLLRWQMV